MARFFLKQFLFIYLVLVLQNSKLGAGNTNFFYGEVPMKKIPTPSGGTSPLVNISFELNYTYFHISGTLVRTTSILLQFESISNTCIIINGYLAFWESQPETVAIVQQQEAHRLVHAAAKQTWDSDEGLHIPDSEEEYERIAKEHRDEDRDVNEASSGNSSGEDDSEEEEENTAVSTSNPFALLGTE